MNWNKFAKCETLFIGEELDKYKLQKCLMSNITAVKLVPAGPALLQNRCDVQLQSFRLNCDTGQATFDPGVITALCTGPQRAAAAAAPFGTTVVRRKWINCGWPVVLDTDWK